MPEQSLSQTSIYSARPTLRIGGQENERASALLQALTMDESEGGMSALELRFAFLAATTGGAPEQSFDAHSDLRLGAQIGAYAGDAAQPRELFAGTVSALEVVYESGRAPELVVLAEDALGPARRSRVSHVYEDLSPADVVHAVAARLGLTAQVDGLNAPQATWAQLNETDLGFVRRLLERFDADVQVVGSRLQVASRQNVRRGEITLAMGQQLRRVRITADLAHQVTTLSAGGWNPRDGAAVHASASALSAAGPGRGRSGPQWAQQVFGARSEHVGALALESDAEARALASSAFDRRARGFVRAEGTAEGNARLRVGSHVTLTGIAPEFDNTYYVVHARHRFDLQHGYRTEFQAECAYLGP